MKKLFKGNLGFVREHGRKLKKHGKGQDPEVVVVTCSDSRVLVHKIFGMEGIGQVFNIEVAGNVCCDPSVVGSVEYAVAHLKPKKLIVLGHTKCGAVKARISEKKPREKELRKLLKHVNPSKRAVVARRMLMEPANKWDVYVYANVDDQVKSLMANAEVKKAARKGLEVLGMVYDLEKGKIALTNRNGRPLKAVKTWTGS